MSRSPFTTAHELELARGELRLLYAALEKALTERNQQADIAAGYREALNQTARERDALKAKLEEVLTRLDDVNQKDRIKTREINILVRENRELPEPRREFCRWCMQWVEDWVDPDWAHGRICRECEAKHEPKEDFDAAP